MGANLITKYTDWVERLNKWTESVEQKPFKWGEHDCCLAACDAVLEVTGFDLAKDFRGRYNDEAGVKELIRKDYGTLENLCKTVAKKAGLLEIDPMKSSRGDLSLCNLALGPTLGICIGKAVMLPSSRRAIFVPLTKIIRAWRVG